MIRKKIEGFRSVQGDYMAGVSQILEEVEHAQSGRVDDVDAEHIPLFLPSDLDVSTRRQVCGNKLIEVEEQLREAQAFEALETLRQSLRARVFATKFKIKNITGQRANTRARQWQKTIDKKAIASKHTYRRARKALLAIRGPGDWESVLRPLEDADVRAFNERAMTQQERFEREAARRASGLTEEQIDAG